MATGTSVALALVGGAYAQVAVLLALATGTLLALWQAHAATAQAQVARAAQARAEGVKQFIASIFTEAKPRDGSGGVVTALALLESATQRIESELAANAAMAGELGVLVGDGCSRLGDLTLGLQALDAAVPRCRQALGDAHTVTLRGRVLQLEAANGNSQFDRVRALSPRLLDELRAQLPAQAELLVMALDCAAFARAKLNDVDGSLAPLREAVSLAETHLGPLHEQTVQILGSLSNTCVRFGLLAEALRVAEDALQRTRKSVGDMRPHTRLTHQERWYADALVNNGRPADAEPIARQVVIDQRALDGELDRRVINAMTSHSMALAGMGRTEEAVAMARKVVSWYVTRSPGADDDALAYAYRLAFCLLPTRRVDDIQAALDRVDSLYRALGVVRTLHEVRHQRMGAQVLAWRGDGAAARAVLDGLEDSSRGAHALEWTRIARVRAMAWRLQGDTAAGLAAAQEAIDRATATQAPAVDRAHAHTELGLLLQDSGDIPAATEQLEQALALYTLAQVRPSVLNADALLGLGRLHLLAGRRAQALASFSQVQALWGASHPGSGWQLQAQRLAAQAKALDA